jgi:hypothetical protein
MQQPPPHSSLGQKIRTKHAANKAGLRSASGELQQMQPLDFAVNFKFWIAEVCYWVNLDVDQILLQLDLWNSNFMHFKYFARILIELFGEFVETHNISTELKLDSSALISGC